MCQTKIGSVDSESPTHCRFGNYITNFDVFKVKIISPAHKSNLIQITTCFEICVSALKSNPNSESPIHGRFGEYITNFDVFNVNIVAPAHKLMLRYTTTCFEICVGVYDRILTPNRRSVADSANMYLSAHFLHFDKLLHAPEPETHNKIQILIIHVFSTLALIRPFTCL